MISTLELRHIIEQSFLPIRCQCTVDSDGSLSVRIYQNNSERETLVVTGISVGKLTNGQDIAGLISELRYDLKSSKQVPWRAHS